MIQKIKNFFTGSFEEFKKVVWPSRKEVISHTVIVIVSIAVSMLIVMLIDLGLFKLVQILIENGK